jgi:hypothetical protein
VINNNIVNNGTNYEKLSLYLCYSRAILRFAQNRQLVGYYYDRGDFEKLKWDMKRIVS